MQATAAEERNGYIDNVKFFLILLVVWGHEIDWLLGEFKLNRTIFLFLYSFHMQMFALVSGFFSNSDTSQKALKMNFFRILLPYFIFQAIFCILKSIVEGTLDYDIFNPHRSLWYLLSLFSWRIILPYYVKLPSPMILSIIAALICGYFQFVNEYLSLSRTIVFFPYFLAGYYLKRNKQIQIKQVIPVQLAICILIILLYVSIEYPIKKGWVLHSMPYEAFGQNEWFAPAFRLLSLSGGFLVGFSFLALIPDTKSVLTKIGTRTIYIYLLHILLLRALLFTGFFSKLPNGWSIIYLIPLTACIILICSTDFVVKTSMILVDPLAFWQLRRKKN